MVGFVHRGRPRTALDIQLRLLDFAVENDIYEYALIALGNGLRGAAQRIKDAADEQAVADYEVEIIENLLGVSYVACQAQIAAVVEAVLNIPGHSLSPPGVRALGPRFNKKYSMVEVLWALGNYFKHRDGWTRKTWTQPNGLAKQTVPIIKAAGLRYGSNGNLRKGAEVLGNASHTNVRAFHRVVSRWSSHVRDHIRAELGKVRR